ncbi:mitochondrial ribosome-associated GTPase 2-like [Oratosquilla oratoria]|uniref:mitochondrial ribosome-associated GTPase 2-like n=1 Tax=Oratosquilla oratoria TaxID=337810 RepID=UPI003F7652CA
MTSNHPSSVFQCSCLLYVIDIAHPRPLEQLETLRYELEQYEKGLSNRPSIIVANKMDLPEAQNNFENFKSGVNLPTLGVSAKLGLSLTPLLASMRFLVDHNLEQKSEVLLY